MKQNTIVSIVLCALAFLGDVAIVTQSIYHGPENVGIVSFVIALGLGIWALFNTVLLSRHTGWTRFTTSPSAATGKAPVIRRAWPLAAVFAVLVAAVCWLGTRPSLPDDSWSIYWGQELDGRPSLYSVGVAGYRSGRPAIGYLWRSVAHGEHQASSPTRIQLAVGHNTASIELDGKSVQPTDEFQLFVNDSHDHPMRLHVSQKEAVELFGRHLDISRLEKFWRDVVEPRR